MTTRRRLLTCLPAGSALLPAAAGAFRPEAPSAAIAADYASGCPATQAHDALRAELDRLREGRPLPPALAPGLARLARCPFCGCAVASAADHGESPAPGR
ncbi:hypothetical protein [Falsiroseomonas tokyonensis]|uniref:Uncharacterized protein n=1 Tax=Falsiroseomonas tokyonensis TaxID=430521 RepID=A0ABV7BX60_9PROT|nr:hypothetical protein [Falsiroseomonas tokyonensis]MBU8540123.1 hypothetical protein [Falsiroseomonas tokyonensis]